MALVALAAILLVAGCGEAARTIRPSASLAEVQFTPRPTRTTTSSASIAPDPTEAATFISIPVGWDDAFCQVFGVTVVAQELIIDIERAIAEENVRDARGLARDLRDTSAEATDLLAELPDWDAAESVQLELTTLIDLYTRAGAEYGTAYAEESRAALRRARALRREVEQETPTANEAFAELSELGITCGDLPLQLEQP